MPEKPKLTRGQLILIIGLVALGVLTILLFIFDKLNSITLMLLAAPVIVLNLALQKTD